MTVIEKIKVLAVDDDQDILYTLTAICRAMSWEICTAADGKRVLEKFYHQKPDLILLDYHMPNQNGLVTVQEIRRIDKFVPIIILTVDERQEVADNFLSAGASDFANKPIKVPDLVARIRIHMQLIQKMRETTESLMICKGINIVTLKLVRDYCRAADGYFFTEDVVERTGLAYQTTVRYLRYLKTNKEVVAISDYGKVGRPRNKYRYIK